MSKVYTIEGQTLQSMCTGGRTTVKTEIASVNVSTIAYTHNSGTDFEPELVLQYSTRLS